MSDGKFYKSLGLCSKCGKHQSAPGRVLCEYCLEKELNRYYKNREKELEKRRIRDKKRYEENKANGLCVICGKKPAYKGRVRCYECLLNKKRRDREKPKKQWAELGLCRDCGAERVEGFCYCDKCLGRRRNIAENARRFINRGGHQWKKDNKFMFKEEMSWQNYQ